MGEGKSTEADALLRVLAPKLEQLRERLASSTAQLKDADADDARLTAVTDALLALKDFQLGIASLKGLVAPIDFLLQALNEEPAVEAQPTIESPPSAPAPLPSAPRPMRVDAHSEDWMQTGIIIAVQKLVSAGMSAMAAEAYVGQACEVAGLTQIDGGSIDAQVISQWRSRLKGPGFRARGFAAKRAAAGDRVSVQEAKARADDLLQILRKMQS